MIDWLQPFLPDLNISIIAVYAVLVVVVLAFFREWAAPDVVALSALGVLLLLGVLPLNDLVENGVVLERGILSVFSNGAPITVACMFILSAGLERTGVIDIDKDRHRCAIVASWIWNPTWLLGADKSSDCAGIITNIFCADF